MDSAIPIAFLVTLVVVAVFEFLRRREKRRADIIAAENSTLQERIQKLAPYERIVDAEAHATALLKTAEEDATARRTLANKYLADATAQAESTIHDATMEGDNIISGAKTRAEEVAGEALKAKGKAELYTNTVKAMRNAIDGIGDEYIVPNHSVLDDLAEEFGHKEAGAALKSARAKTRAAIRDGDAAKCDYVDQRRASTAIRFVLDAFNGKVDSALAKVKHNNLGKVRQEITDAFSLVNQNGEAFRNARIEFSFLRLRLEELQWAVSANELKLIEREEQRKIKEAMREEERARREYEKAVKEAQKEERMLEKAMEKARKELEGANQDQRVEYERKLQELEQKWKEAEEKNQRAISMAQQTRRGHVYVISNIGSFGDDVFKIGLTRRLEPLDRVKELGDASVPFEFDVHAMIFSEDAPTLEKRLHQQFAAAAVNRVNSRKEFFRLGIKGIRQWFEASGFNEIHWTMTAEAKEYRETLAIERAESPGNRPGVHATTTVPANA